MQQNAAFLLQDRAVISVSEPDCSQGRSSASRKLTGRKKNLKKNHSLRLYLCFHFLFHLKIGFNNHVFNGTAGEEWAKHLLHFGISVLSRV